MKTDMITALASPLSSFTRIPERRFIRITEVVEPEVLINWGAKIFTLMNLSWQYIDTILDIVIQMKIRETKPLVRTIRQIKLDYDRFRAAAIDSESVRQETELAESFEDMLGKQQYLSKLFYALDFEVCKLDLVKEQRPLVIATYQALTIMEATKIYARMIDDIVRHDHRIDVKDCCMIQEDFMKLYHLVPQFAGDCYHRNLPAVVNTASIIASKMNQSIIKITHYEK